MSTTIIEGKMARLPARVREIRDRALEATTRRKGTLDSRELATILAALRLGQDQYQWLCAMPHFAEQEPLTEAEIDALCERLNGTEFEVCS